MPDALPITPYVKTVRASVERFGFSVCRVGFWGFRVYRVYRDWSLGVQGLGV